MGEEKEPVLHWRKNINLFLTGQFLSGITSMIVQYAIIWYLTKETGSATILSFATLLGMIPMVLLSPFAESVCWSVGGSLGQKAIVDFDRYHCRVVCNGLGSSRYDF